MNQIRVRMDAALSARAQRFLHGGMLHVHISRALNLQSSAQLTKKFRIHLRVSRGGREDHVYSKLSEQSGLGKQLNSVNPVLDSTIDMLIDGDTARDPTSVISVEIVVEHFIKKSSSRGTALVDFSSVVKAGRMQGRWKLTRGVADGTSREGSLGEVEMSLAWVPTLH